MKTTAKSLDEYLEGTKIIDSQSIFEKGKATMTITFYKDKADEWRWQVKGQNGEIVGASTEGFADEHAARANATLLCEALTKWKESRRS